MTWQRGLFLLAALTISACSNPESSTADAGGGGDANINCVPACDNKTCGDDGCGGHCGTCAQGTTCNAAGKCECVPEDADAFCERVGKKCGTATGTDNCGGARTEQCDLCVAPNICDRSLEDCVCLPEPITEFCARLGKQCGTMSANDICGVSRTVDCGTCSGGKVCDSTTNQCVTCTSETPVEFCARLHKECGTVTADDNCGVSQTYECPACLPTQACGADNVCHCAGETNTELCTAANKHCGSLTATDRCGASRTVAECGPCASGDLCTNGTCCTPQTDVELCQAAGKTCGALAVTDRCGTSRTIANCGSCTGGAVCTSAGGCCTPPTDAALCGVASKTCGALTLTDACGTNRNVTSCGSCNAGEMCSNGTCTVCTLEDDATFCSRLGKSCGAVTALDNCGYTRTVASCGSCTSPQYCDPTSSACVASATPTNDDCTAPTALAFDSTGSVTFLADTTLANGTGDGSCNSASGHDVVFSFELTAVKDVDILATPLTGSGAKPNLYIRTTCDQTSSEIACVKTSASSTPVGLNLSALPAGTYYLWVDGWSSGTNGPQTITIVTSDPVTTAPPNDLCLGAEQLTFSGNTATGAGSTRGATNDSSGSCTTLGGPDVVYSFTLAADAGVQVKVTGTTPGFTPSFYVLDACGSGAIEKLCAAGAGGTAMGITPTVLTAGTYFLVVDSASGSGAFTVEVTSGVVINDTCASVQPITFNSSGVATIAGDTSMGSDGIVSSCNGAGTGKDLVWSFEVVGIPMNVEIVVDPAPGSAIEPNPSVRTTCDQQSTEVGCATVTSSGLSARLKLRNLAVGTYYLWLDGWAGSTNGPFTMTVTMTTPPPVPANDTCAGVEAIAIDPTTKAGAVSASTADANDNVSSSCDSSTGYDVVYSFEVPAGIPQNVQIDVIPTAGSAFRPNISVRTQCDFSGTEIGCKSISAQGDPAQLKFKRLAPGTYYLWVDGSGSGYDGPFTLGIQLADPPSPPPEDVCTRAATLTLDGSGHASATGSTEDATDDYSGTCGTMTGPDVVYQVTLPAASSLSASVTGTGFYPSVYIRAQNACTSALPADQKACASGSSATQAVSVPVLAAGTYYVFVDGGNATAYGSFTLDVQTGQPINNFTCATAEALSFDPVTNAATVISDTSLGFDTNTSSTCNGSGTGKDLAFSFEITARMGRQDVSINVTPLAGSALNPNPVLRTVCNQISTEIGCVYKSTVAPATLSVRKLNPGTYYLWVDGYWTTSNGPFTMTVTLTPSAPAPANDTCAAAEQLNIDSTTGVATAVGNTDPASGDLAGSCAGSGANPDVVYTFTTSREQNIALTVTPDSGSTLQPVVYVRSNCTDSATELGCNYSSSATTAAAVNYARLPAGTYFVIVDSNSATATGSFTLSLTTTAPPSPPSNDTCALPEALVFDTATNKATVTGSTADAINDYAGTCSSGSTLHTGPDVAYSFTLGATQKVKATVARDASTPGYRPAVYIRTACASAAAADEVACGNESSGTATATASILPAGTYYVIVDGISGSAGSYTLTVEQMTVVNDNCASAAPLTFDANGHAAASGDTTVGVSDAAGNCFSGSSNGRDLVYSFDTRGMGTQHVAVSLTYPGHTGFGAVLYLRSVCASSATADELACDGHYSGGHASIAANVPEGTYYIWVDDGYSSEYGPFDLSVQLTTLNPPPSNDTCRASDMLTFNAGVATATGSTMSATNDYTGSCGTHSGGDVVYTMVLAQDALVKAKVTATNASTYTAPAVYIRSACDTAGSTAEVACNTGSSGISTAVNTGLVAGTYYVIVDGNAGSGGDFTLEVTLGTPLLNDTCAHPEVLAFDPTTGVAVVNGDNTYAGGSGDPSCNYGSGPDLVYSFTLSADKSVHATMAGSSTIRPNIYLRTSCTGGTELACNMASSNGGTAVIDLPRLTAGTTYYLWVDSYSSTNVGAFTLTVTLSDPPAVTNDTCRSAEVLNFTSGQATATGATTYATNDSVPTCDPGLGADVVYTFTTSGAQKVVATVARDSSSSSYNPLVYIRTTCGSAADTDEVTCAKPSSGTATATVNNLPGGTYYLIVDGTGTSVGGFTLTVTLSAAVTTGPLNENCASAETLTTFDAATNTFSATGTTTGAQNEASGSCGSSTGPDVVYKFTTTADQKVSAKVMAGSGLAPAAYIRTACGSSGTEAACSYNSTTGGTTTAVARYLPAGTYYVWVDSGSGSSSGLFQLEVKLDAPVYPPANDRCAGAIALTLNVPVDGDTTLANNDFNSGTACSAYGYAGNDVVFTYTPTTSGSFTASAYQQGTTNALGSAWDGVIWIATTCDGSTCLARGDVPESATITNATAGTTYWIVLDGYSSGAMGPFTILVHP